LGNYIHKIENGLQRYCTEYGQQSRLTLSEAIRDFKIHIHTISNKNRVSLEVMNFVYCLSNYYFNTTYLKITYEKL
jgi:hypothetical protein